MPNHLVRWLLCTTLLIPALAMAAPPPIELPGVAIPAVAPPATKSKLTNLFDCAADSWGIGTIRLGKPLRYREGEVLLFPSQFAELFWAKLGKPRNIMLVYEVPADEKDKPFFADKDEFFAPIRLLSTHAYWRDNLPNTPRHEVYGGRHNTFRGEEMAEAKRVLGPWLEAVVLKGKDAAAARLTAVAGALGSSVTRIREDAVAHLVAAPTLGQDLGEAAQASLATYLKGGAPAQERATLIAALGSAKVSALLPTIRAIASTGDAAGVAARRVLVDMGETVPTAPLDHKP